MRNKAYRLEHHRVGLFDLSKQATIKKTLAMGLQSFNA